jgi:hypothetical protein
LYLFQKALPSFDIGFFLAKAFSQKHDSLLCDSPIFSSGSEDNLFIDVFWTISDLQQGHITTSCI